METMQTTEPQTMPIVSLIDADHLMSPMNTRHGVKRTGDEAGVSGLRPAFTLENAGRGGENSTSVSPAVAMPIFRHHDLRRDFLFFFGSIASPAENCRSIDADSIVLVSMSA